MGSIRDLIPFVLFAIPIITIIGGIAIGIIRAIGEQRLLELAQRERIAAIERGLDPTKLPRCRRPSTRGSRTAGARRLSGARRAF